ncbi:hypothetical protein MINT15_24860 [Saccharomonospora viridis]|uniref:Uncharacterized protein n=1 Tax=Saccharomonospora viridis TaxID=1852 RepID=A0A837DAX6_9PSEU|nr:hypothetical protein MINT15_24860 [Saccharomonospora viridis]
MGAPFGERDYAAGDGMADTVVPVRPSDEPNTSSVPGIVFPM